MSGTTFRALVTRETSKGIFHREIETRTLDDLPPGDLLIRVQYSSLNYKDALSASGHKGITRQYPHTPGIDAVGIVETSDDPGFVAGQPVVVTGRDLGMNTSGGFGEYIRVPAFWAIPLPDGLTPEEAIAYGTAGYTAVDSVMRVVEAGVTPDRGNILVTGSTGGVGCLAVGILSKAGYRVTAATGKPDAADFLKSLGATEIVSREDVLAPADRPLCKGRWASVIECVGGQYLDSAIRSTMQHGIVTCCGMIDSLDVRTSIFPFIIRGVALVGIDSAESPRERRLMLWQKLASEWKVPHLTDLVTMCELEDLDERIERMLAGRSKGRVCIRHCHT